MTPAEHLATLAIKEGALEVATKIGTTLIIKYAPTFIKKIRPRKVETRLYSTIVFNFYPDEDYQNVFEAISETLDNYRVKEFNRSLLKLKNLAYEYWLDIIPKQDYIPLKMLLEELPSIAFNQELMGEESSYIPRVSSAHLYIWPFNVGKTINVEMLKEILNTVYEFYKELWLNIDDRMKSGQLVATRVTLYFTFTKVGDPFKKEMFKILNNSKISNKVTINLHYGKFEFLVDDSLVINEIVKMFGGK